MSSFRVDGSHSTHQLPPMSEALKAPAVVAELIEEGHTPTRLDQSLDHMKLIGAVLGQVTLMEVAVMGSKDSDRVSAAKELIKLDEDPEVIAERLKAAPFADLDVYQLRGLVEMMQSRPLHGTSLDELIEEARLIPPPDEEDTNAA